MRDLVASYKGRYESFNLSQDDALVQTSGAGKSKRQLVNRIELHDQLMQ